MTSEQPVSLLVTPDPLPDHGPLVSVLIPSYNYSQFVGQAIRSVMDQTYRNLEIVVVDNCSTDGSWDVVQAIAGGDARFSLHRNETNVGILENFRRCFNVASGQFFMVLNADDRLLSPRAVSRLVAALESTSDVTMATSHRQYIDASGSNLAEQRPPISAQDIVVDGKVFGNMMLNQLTNGISEASTIFRKDLIPTDDDFYRIGGVDCTYYIDMVWWLKILASGKVAYIAEPLGQFRVHSDQSSMSHLRDPLALPAWLPIIRGAKELGYLADPADERNCLCRLGAMMFTLIPGYDGAERESLDGLVEHIHDVTRSVVALTMGGER